MFMKLSFTSDKSLNDVFRIANEIINQSSITDATTLNTYLNTNADATVKAGYDASNSLVLKTTTLSTAKSHYSRAGTGTSALYASQHEWTVEFQAYDSTRKYYVQQSNVTTTAQSTTKIGSAITGGTISSSQLPISSTDTASVDGTILAIAGTNEAGSQLAATSTNGFSNVRTFWMHISDYGMIWATTNTNSSSLGFSNTYNNPANYSGPWIFGQYARHDYHNTDANGVIPLMYTNLHRGTGQGFGASVNDWQQSHNSMATSPTYTTGPFRVFNLVNAHPQAGTSWPLVNFPFVNWGTGQRFDDVWALNGTSQGTITSVNSSSYGAVIFETVSTRYPSADLKSQGFAMIPLCWRQTYYGNTGGNMTDKTGYYLFNGDYFPGDQFSYNNKTYVILPTYVGYSNRVGIAVPME